MSLDNGIYIIKDKEGYRVAHCQAIENIYYDKSYIDEYFGDKYYEKEIEAWEEARRLYFEIEEKYPVEYGIQYLGEIKRLNKEY